MSVLTTITEQTALNRKQLALLLDPDSFVDLEDIYNATITANEQKVDFIFVGGSHLVDTGFNECVATIKKYATIPVVLFPGSPLQIDENADALLFLSVISGRNPEMLIGHHVIAAPKIKASGIETIPTGYILINSGTQTAASYMSNTTPIPWDQNDIAASTALAGEMLGLKVIYLDAGSGAKQHISEQMIRKVKERIQVPLIVGGGIKSKEAALSLWNAGADILVIGNAAEQDLGIVKSVMSLKSNKHWK